MLVALGAGAFAMSPASIAQQPARVFRIGFLSSELPAAWVPRTDAFRAGLHELGYVEGRNIEIEFRWAEGKYDRLPELAAELVRRKPDLIVAGAAPASRAVKEATKEIPIVMLAVGDIVEFGLVSNLARPGGNFTGSTFFSVDLAAKRFELLRDAFPRAKRVAVLVNPAHLGHGSTLKAVQSAANSLKLALQTFEVWNASDLEPAFAAMAKARMEALVIPNQPILNVNAERIANLASARQIPSIGGTEFAEVGCLLGYGASFIEMYRRGAYFVDRILKGTKPNDLPIERATRFELVINMKTAKTLGISIPQSVLVRADRVIE